MKAKTKQNRLFKNALTDIKKQSKPSESSKNQSSNKQQSNIQNYDDMSSSEIQKLNQLGVNIKKTKQINKQQHYNNKNHYNQNIKNKNNKQQRWQHDKYRKNLNIPYKSNTHTKSYSSLKFQINFLIPQPYHNIINIIKSQKAFISQIDQTHLISTRQQSYENCIKLLSKQNISFQVNNKQNNTRNEIKEEDKIKDKDKQSIFNRLK